MQKRRMISTIVAGFVVEIANKIFPLLTLRFAEERLGLGPFGFAQFCIALVDFFVPFVTFGYHTYGTLLIGARQGDAGFVGGLVRRLAKIKLLHAGIAFIALEAVVWLIPTYAPYRTAATVLGLYLFTSALDMTYVWVGTQRMLQLSILSVIAKTIGLAAVLTLVRDPNDALFYAGVTLAANGIISLVTLVGTLRRYPRTQEDTSFRALLRASAPYGVTIAFVVLNERFDMFAVEALLGLTAAGLYAGALRLMKSLQPFVYTLSNIFFSEMVAVRDEESLQTHVKWSLAAMLAITCPLAVGSWFVGGDLLVFVMGEHYREAGLTFALLATSLFVDGLIYVFGHQVLVVKGRPRYLNWGLFMGGVLGVSSTMVLAPAHGIAGIATAILIAKGTTAIWVMVAAHPLVKRFPVREAARVGIATVSMGVALWVLRDAHWVTRFLGGGALYALALVLFFRDLVDRILKAGLRRKSTA